ncbi:hypothetical protein B0G76_1352 [Paraburkholderia sp. BL23I1N1]|uniref:head-tail joining protein n=1 Tax=Paraburkholderia sp. BL23I1N1 TaxID=1938802 RepID=UPI000E751769|nr:hypothetical protein [Paraburkholderia sp. BL23I1N1]RKE35291.1 hypothetical protein B0G76_1352 [Paraburkholderia sp. BL23I1N1]
MIDFDGTLNAAISTVLGDEVPIAFPGVSTPVLGIFSLITDHIFSEEGVASANITVATLGLQVSQLPAPPQQGIVVQINGASYVVKDIAVDGLGWAYLDLGAQ